MSFVPFAEFDDAYVDPLVRLTISDVWGWVDPETGDEYVLVGKTSGVAFFRVTDPTAPVYLGDLVNPSWSQWQPMDMKVHADHAFVVSESEEFGMQVFDLTRLRGVDSEQLWIEDAHYAGVLSSHNLAINEETGFAYVVGGNLYAVGPLPVWYSGDQCSGGLHVVDVSDPLVPAFAGCWSGDGYVHDVQCVLYHGPDAEHRGRELCFTAAEDRVTIVDVTDKLAPQRIGTLRYPETGYTHQGWLTEDHRFFVFGDEFDELELEAPTRTLIADVSDLERPVLVGVHTGSTTSTDHNQFIRDGLVHQSNYTAGYRVLATTNLSRGALEERAFFDTYPDGDHVGYDAGSWGNYPFLPSGTVAVTSMREGLFLVRPHVARVRRLAGADRAGTAAAVSRATFDRGTDTVVIASASSYADALSGAPLAGLLGAPVLLSGPDQLPDSTAAEVGRLSPRRAFLLGGQAVLSEKVVASLRQAGVEEIVRLGGADRFETAASVANVVLESGDARTVYVVEGVDPDPSRGWPDAVSVAGLAAFQGSPVFLVATDDVPRATSRRLSSLAGTVDRVVIVGGTAAVSSGVEEQVRSLGFEVERIAGADRYATSHAVARLAREVGADPAMTWLATGTAFADALAAGPAAAATGGIVHLVAREDVGPWTSAWFEAHACMVRMVSVVGGPAVVSDTASSGLLELLNRADCGG